VRQLLNIVKRYFVSGVLVVVPLILTYLVLKFLLEAVDNILRPMIEQVFGYYVFGLGVLTTILLILLAGVLTRNFVGAQLYRYGERILGRMPIIRPVYSAAKQLLEAIAMPSTSTFKEVVLVEYPRRGAYAVGFVAKEIALDTDGTPRKHTVVFVPSTPTPVSGIVIIVPSNEVTPLDLTLEEGAKFLVSGGAASPEKLRRKVGFKNSDDNEVRYEVG